MARTSAPQATSPWALPWADAKAVAVRSWREASDDNVGLVAAGVAFYGFLAIVPLLGATVLTYGLFADPRSVVGTVEKMTTVMPADAARLVGEQLLGVVRTSDGKKGLGLLVALAVALFGARNGAGAVITALNIAYEEDEKRGWLRLNLTTIAITAGAVIAALVAAGAMTALTALDDWLAGTPGLAVLGQILSYLLLTLAGAAAAATLYRFGPSRAKPRWQWITPGSILAALGWVVLTLGFGFYVSRFGNYNATYGSLGAVVVLLTWLYLSSYVLLFGAELNSEFEHQTAADTTTGAAQPLGARKAWVADHVAGEPRSDHRVRAPSADGRSLARTEREAPEARDRVRGRTGVAVVAGAGALAILLRRRWSGLALLGLTVRQALVSRGEPATARGDKTEGI